MPSAAEVLILLAAILGSGSVVGFGGWFLFRIKRLEVRARADDAEIERLVEQVAAIGEQLAGVRDAVGELQERLDFAERLLTSGRPEQVDQRDGRRG